MLLVIFAIVIMFLELFGGLTTASLSLWFSHQHADTNTNVSPLFQLQLLVVSTHFWLVGGGAVDREDEQSTLWKCNLIRTTSSHYRLYIVVSMAKAQNRRL